MKTLVMILSCLSAMGLPGQEDSLGPSLEEETISPSDPEGEEGEKQSWEGKFPLFELTADQIFVLETDFQDERGSVSTQSSQASIRKSFPISGSSFIGFNVRYQFAHFEFSDFVLNGRKQDPFGNVHSTSIGIQYRQEFTEKLSSFLLAAGSSAMEEGAEFSESLKPRVFAMALYKWFEKLTTGIGVGILYDLDDDLIAFPVVSIEWEITDRLELRVRNDMKFSYLLLPENNLKISFNTGFSRQFGARTFRLSESGPAPGGIAEFRGFSIGLLLEWEPVDKVTLGAFAGVLPWYELKIEDRRGHRVFRDRLNPAIQLGLSFALAF